MSGYFTDLNGVGLDPIMAIDELFRNDLSSDKINLVVGVYQNNSGKTPVLESVKAAEAQLVSTEHSKAYLPIAGEPLFLELAESLVLGAEGQEVGGRPVRSVQTPGSTSALRVAAEFIRQSTPSAKVWISAPGYSNHRPIFSAAGLGMAEYRYYDVVSGSLLFDEMLADLSSAPAGDAVLLHACCHNPTGADLTVQQWRKLAVLLNERSLLPIVDAAYLGLASDVDQDAAGLRALVSICPETIVAASFSKNFALYSERVGLLSLIGSDLGHVTAAVARAKVYVRALYTSPPSHGAQVVARILADEKLRTRWLTELEAMRQKLLDVRLLLAEGLESHGIGPELFPALKQNRGMFTLSRISKTDVVRLREQHHIYVLDNGRVSFGGMREADIPKLCAAISEVRREQVAAA
jgi:aspartate/tyrosine/aromatic aminotransferase